MTSQELYTGYIRIRVGGFYNFGGKILLVKLRSPITGEDVWIPPGGGVEYQESLEEAVIREFLEESNLRVKVGKLRHIHELIENEFHVIEFFFDVEKKKGEVKLGVDPEHNSDSQLISDIGFFSEEEIKTMNVKPDFLKDEYWKNPKAVSFLGNR